MAPLSVHLGYTNVKGPVEWDRGPEDSYLRGTQMEAFRCGTLLLPWIWWAQLKKVSFCITISLCALIYH